MISDVTATASSAAAAKMKETAGLNKDDFLKLFIAQMKNQDPLNPMDGTEFVGQLAQLTQVEQAYNTNSNLEKLIKSMSNSSAFSATSLIGQKVTAAGDKISLQSGTPQELVFDLSAQAASASIEVKNSSGQVVRTFSAGSLPSGRNSLVWDGKSASGAALPSGTYSYSVSAKNSAGSAVSATTYTRATATGISMSGAEPTVSLGGLEVPLSQIAGIGN